MRKGFLTGGASSKKSSKSKGAARQDDIPTIKPRVPPPPGATGGDPGLQLPEVQEAMRAGQVFADNTGTKRL